MSALVVTQSPAVADASVLVRRFLNWSEHAFPHDRADAVNALARVYLHGDWPDDARAEAEVALTRALDDPEPRVRRAMAEAFAGAQAAPRHIVLALAADVSEVSRCVLAHSPLLADADLVDCVGFGDASAQRAIARRSPLRRPVAAALAAVADRPALLALIANLDADVGRKALWRVFERFPEDAVLREQLLERPGLPTDLRAAIAAATASDLSGLATERRWIDPRRAERLARDGREQAFVALARDCSDEELPDLVAWLRAAGHLTVALLARALSGGDLRLFAQSLADMAAMPITRVDGLVRDPQGRGFAALYARAGLPAHLLPAFKIAAEMASEGGVGGHVDTSLTMRMLRAIEARQDAALAPFVALLWRLASEGARADARDVCATSLAPGTEIGSDSADGVHAPLRLSVQPGNENLAPAVTLAGSTREAFAA